MAVAPGAAGGVAAGDAATSPAAAGQGAPGFAYVGTYTPNGGGIYLFRVDRATGEMSQVQVVDDIKNPSWLALNAAKTRLYAVSEIDNFEGTRNGRN